jgi:hypothetical protein
MSDTVLDTLEALVSACLVETQAGRTLEGVSISDGAAVTSADQGNRLFIGMTVDDPTLAIEASDIGENLPGVVESESFAILCVAEAWSGETSDQTTRRARASQTYRAVRALLRPNTTGITLGVQQLASARVGSWSMRQSQTSKGLVVTIEFRIECMARPVVI